MASFQLTLPIIEVDDLRGPYRLEHIAKDINRNYASYIIPGCEPLATVFRDYQAQAIVKPAQGIFISYLNAEFQLTGYLNIYWVRSSNGWKTITDDSNVAEGYFASLPQVMLTPERGERIDGN